MDNFNKPYIKLMDVSNKNGYRATVEMDIKNTKGIVKRINKTIKLDDDVKLYAKLPDKFLIETPIGNYNPDWAVLIEKNGVEKLYFIVETKGTTDEEQLRFTEDAKINCGRKHFAALETGIEYQVASDYFELKGRMKI